MLQISQGCAPVADDDNIETEALRLTRDHGDRGPSFVERLSDRLDRMTFSSPLHRMRLKGRFPLKLLAVPVDPVAGNAKIGARLKGGRLYLAGHGQAMADARFDNPLAPPAWTAWVHGWGWLRDIATLSRLQLPRPLASRRFPAAGLRAFMIMTKPPGPRISLAGES